MELQQRTLPARAAGTPDVGDTGGVSQVLNDCRRLADASDAAIDQVYSNNPELVINSNQQSVGE